jgi:drug/metabolite transporter (DMT)-like permease
VAKATTATSANAGAAAHPIRGMILFSFGLLCFTCMDATTKYLATHHEVPLIVAVRYLVNCLLMIVLLAPTQGAKLIETQRTGLVVVRSLCLAVASLCVASALRLMPLAETTAIVFMSPLVVMLMVGPVLRERVGRLPWIATGLGLVGMLLIVRPGSGLDALAVCFALGAVAANTGYQLFSRLLAASETTLALLFYSALVGSICFGIALPVYWEGRVPTPFELLLFLSLGVYGAVGHFFYTRAYRETPASVLAPLNYIQVVWAGLLGWLVFGHVPDRLTILGMCVIAASGAIVAFRPQASGKGHAAAAMPEASAGLPGAGGAALDAMPIDPPGRQPSA